MTRKKRKKACPLCGELNSAKERYYAIQYDGRPIFVCPGCKVEARIGKFGEENKGYRREMRSIAKTE